jgi:protocatechuate 3,4-dioxygenase, alpha subunit
VSAPSEVSSQNAKRSPEKGITAPPTGSQTVGPFFHLGFAYLECQNLAGESVAGERVTIRGKVLDGDGNIVPDAVLEIWQADPAGRYASDISRQNSAAPRFLGFGRIETDDNGEFQFTTTKPGRVPSPDDGLQAPHLVITLFSRGLLKPLLTRVYFPDEPSNAADPILKLVPPERRSTLIAKRSAEAGAKNGPENTSANAPVKILDWTIVMQGEGETVFFDY